MDYTACLGVQRPKSTHGRAWRRATYRPLRLPGNHLEGLLKHHKLHLQSFCFSRSQVESEICTSNKVSGAADAVGLGSTVFRRKRNYNGPQGREGKKKLREETEDSGFQGKGGKGIF